MKSICAEKWRYSSNSLKRSSLNVQFVKEGAKRKDIRLYSIGGEPAAHRPNAAHMNILYGPHQNFHYVS